jgi:hypothetical protein
VAIDAPITTSVDALVYRGPDDAAIATLFDRLGFDTLRTRVTRRA